MLHLTSPGSHYAMMKLVIGYIYWIPDPDYSSFGDAERALPTSTVNPSARPFHLGLCLLRKLYRRRLKRRQCSQSDLSASHDPWHSRNRHMRATATLSSLAWHCCVVLAPRYTPGSLCCRKAEIYGVHNYRHYESSYQHPQPHIQESCTYSWTFLSSPGWNLRCGRHSIFFSVTEEYSRGRSSESVPPVIRPEESY